MMTIISTLDEKLLKVQKPINSLLKNQLIKVEMVQLQILQYQRQNIDLEAFLLMVLIYLLQNSSLSFVSSYIELSASKRFSFQYSLYILVNSGSIRFNATAT